MRHATTACTFCISQLPKELRSWSILYIWHRNVLRATTACAFSTAQLSKVLRRWSVLYILTWACDSRHATQACTFCTSQLPKVLRTRCAFHILTSKCASSKQGCALFEHLNFQTCSEHEVFLAFWLRNLLRGTTGCNVSSLVSPDGSAPAALASLLLDPPEPQNIGKTQCFATFLPIRAPASAFFWLLPSSDFSLLWSSFFFLSLLGLFAPLLFHLSIVSKVWLLSFLRQQVYKLFQYLNLHPTAAFWRPPSQTLVFPSISKQPKAPSGCFHSQESCSSRRGNSLAPRLVTNVGFTQCYVYPSHHQLFMGGIETIPEWEAYGIGLPTLIPSRDY